MLLIYSENPDAPRLRYTMELLFGHLLPCAYEIIGNKKDYRSYEGPRLNYSRQRLEEKELFLPAGGLLFEAGVRSLLVGLYREAGPAGPALFPRSYPGVDLPFDLPAMVFYLLSRYEEYLPFAPDRHGRFPATASLAGQQGFLDRPVVDEWAGRLAALLQRRFPGWADRRSGYRFLPTYDIDLPWAFRHRSLYRQAGGAMRDFLYGRTAELQLRYQVLSRSIPDPYYTFPYLDQLNKKYALQPVYFFLLATPGAYDPNPAPGTPALQELIRDLAQRYRTGIHPSYFSSEEPRRMRREVDRLRRITGAPVRRSRQHFLRFRLPHTYRSLLDCGIRQEYSMGFADATGFRAGTATPFPWYDLEEEKETDLMIYPFQAMDGTLRHYLKLSPDAALERLQMLARRTKAVGGRFSTLWHNSSFSMLGGWSGWQAVYEELVKSAVE